VRHICPNYKCFQTVVKYQCCFRQGALIVDGLSRLNTDRLRYLREQRGWSQRELARLCGFGETQIRRYEAGIVDPSATNLGLIADVLETSADYLLDRTDASEVRISETALSKDETDLMIQFRSEGWSGVTRLGVERTQAEVEAEREVFRTIANSLIEQAELLNHQRDTLVDQIGLVTGQLTRLSNSMLILKGIQTRLNILFPDEVFTFESIQAVAEHPIAQLLMSILQPNTKLPRGIRQLYMLLFFDEDRQLSSERAELLRQTWHLISYSVKNQ